MRLCIDWIIGSPFEIRHLEFGIPRFGIYEKFGIWNSALLDSAFEIRHLELVVDEKIEIAES